jgi:hypothetical protein
VLFAAVVSVSSFPFGVFLEGNRHLKNLSHVDQAIIAFVQDKSTGS